jgi:hypothetical protein
MLLLGQIIICRHRCRRARKERRDDATAGHRELRCDWQPLVNALSVKAMLLITAPNHACPLTPTVSINRQHQSSASISINRQHQSSASISIHPMRAAPAACSRHITIHI